MLVKVETGFQFSWRSIFKIRSCFGHSWWHKPVKHHQYNKYNGNKDLVCVVLGGGLLFVFESIEVNVLQFECKLLLFRRCCDVHVFKLNSSGGLCGSARQHVLLETCTEWSVRHQTKCLVFFDEKTRYHAHAVKSSFLGRISHYAVFSAHKTLFHSFPQRQFLSSIFIVLSSK